MPTYEFRVAVPTKTAARALGCDASRVRKLVNRGLLEGFKDGSATRIFVDSISAYQSRHALVGSNAAESQHEGSQGLGGLKNALSRLSERGLLGGEP